MPHEGLVGERFAGYPLAPLLIGFILGGMLENNFSRAVTLADGISFLWERPMTLSLLIIAIGLIVVPAVRRKLLTTHKETS